MSDPYDKKTVRKVLAAYRKESSIRAAAESLGMPKSTFYDILQEALNQCDKNVRADPSKLSEFDLKKVLDVCEKAPNKTTAARELGISRDSLNVRIEEAYKRGLTFFRRDMELDELRAKVEEIEKDPLVLLEKDRTIRKLQDELKVFKNKLEVSEKQVGELQDAHNLISHLDEKDRPKLTIKPRTGKNEATAILIASDWHIEEPVLPETVNGYNEYNLDIARERAKNFFRNGLYMIKKEQQNANIDSVVLALIGDFITGYIHPELEEEALLSPPMALEMAEELIIEGIDFLLKDGCFKKLIIPCCYGNHARTTKKIRVSTGWQNSYETLMYRHLAKLYEKNDRVTFKVSMGYHNILDVYGHILRFHHGDGIRGGSGIGGITIPVNRAISRWNDKEHATMDFLGHFHQLQFQSRFICNGSLIGYSPFAARIGAAPEEPKQAFCLIDKKHGRTVCAPIFVAD